MAFHELDSTVHVNFKASCSLQKLNELGLEHPGLVVSEVHLTTDSTSLQFEVGPDNIDVTNRTIESIRSKLCPVRTG